MNTKLLAIAALGVLALGASGGMEACAMPAASLSNHSADAVPVAYRRHRRARITVYPQYAPAPVVPYYNDYSYYYPAVRGFGDRNPIPRGNIRGCSVDLGYGRYESCDK